MRKFHILLLCLTITSLAAACDIAEQHRKFIEYLENTISELEQEREQLQAGAPNGSAAYQSKQRRIRGELASKKRILRNGQNSFERIREALSNRLKSFPLEETYLFREELMDLASCGNFESLESRLRSLSSSANIKSETESVLTATRAYLFKLLGDENKALSLFEEAIDISPERIELLKDASESALAIGLYEESVSYIEDAIILLQSGASKNDFDLLKQIAEINLESGNYDDVPYYLESALASARLSAPRDDQEILRLNESLASAYSILGKYEQAISIRVETINGVEAERLVPPEHDTSILFELYTGLAYDFLNIRDFESALNAANEAEKRGGTSNLNTTRILQLLASIYQSSLQLDRAISLYREALSLAMESLDKEDYRIGALHHKLAFVLHKNGEYLEALEHYRKSLKLTKIHYGNQHPLYGLRLNGIASCLDFLGDYESALENYKAALGIIRSKISEGHPWEGAILNNIGCCLCELGRLDEAEEPLKQSLLIRIKSSGEESPEVGTTLNNLGMLYADSKQFEKATVFLEKSRSILITAHGHNHPAIATLNNNIALCKTELGEFTTAKKLFEESISIFRNNLGSSHPDLAKSLNSLGTCLTKMGLFTEASNRFKEAISINEKRFSKTHPLVISGRLNLARCLSHFDHESAFKEYEVVRETLEADQSPIYPDLEAVIQEMENLKEARPPNGL